jgi:hypothetical protein
LAAEDVGFPEPLFMPVTAEVVWAKVSVPWAVASDISSRAWVLRLPTSVPGGYPASMAA